MGNLDKISFFFQLLWMRFPRRVASLWTLMSVLCFRLVGKVAQSVLHNFLKWQGSCTSMLPSEHLFLSFHYCLFPIFLAAYWSSPVAGRYHSTLETRRAGTDHFPAPQPPLGQDCVKTQNLTDSLRWATIVVVGVWRVWSTRDNWLV